MVAVTVGDADGGGWRFADPPYGGLVKLLIYLLKWWL